MSKISLQPNASGAGTFSIVAPDSNTNRTLTLPDESGAVLSDSSTIDSNNLQSDVYKQDNIVGTVSESGGVPTEAIIERGSNSNGEYVRYADGTQIIWSEGLSRSTAAWVVFSYTYPVTFASRPHIQMNLFDVSSGDAFGNNRNWQHFPAPRNTGNSSTEYVARRESSSGTSSGPTIYAIGRWY